MLYSVNCQMSYTNVHLNRIILIKMHNSKHFMSLSFKLIPIQTELNLTYGEWKKDGLALIDELSIQWDVYPTISRNWNGLQLFNEIKKCDSFISFFFSEKSFRSKDRNASDRIDQGKMSKRLQVVNFFSAFLKINGGSVLLLLLLLLKTLPVSISCLNCST